jgi:small nuclear ribonucleoprotein (snRNP)-like protein
LGASKSYCIVLNVPQIYIEKGKRVELQVRTGEMYEGILHAVSTDKGLGCVIKMAHKKDLKDKKELSKPIPTFIVLPQDLVQIYAKEVSFDNFRERGILLLL